MLMIMVSSRTDSRSTFVSTGDSTPRGSTLRSPITPAISRVPLVRRRDEGAARVARGHALQRVILTQREGGPGLRQFDPPEVRMPVEDDAEEVEDLAFVPVRRREQPDHRRDVRVLAGHTDLDAQPVPVLHRIQVVRNPDPRIATRPVGTGDIREGIEPQCRIGPEALQQIQQPASTGDQRDLAPALHHVPVRGSKQPGQFRRLHLILASRITLAWSLRIPYISISGRGGHPAVYTSTGTIVSTPWMSA